MTLGTKKTIYGISSVLAPLIGTACGVGCAIIFAIAGLYTPSAAELAEMKEHSIVWSPAAHILSENARRDFVGDYSVWLIFGALLFAVLVIGMCILTGQLARNEDGSIKLNWFDRIWTELHLIVFMCVVVVAVCCAYPFCKFIPMVKWLDFYEPIMVNHYVFDPLPNSTVMVLSTTGMLVGIELAILCFVTIVKKFKARKFLETALLGKLCIKLARGVRNIWDKTTLPDDNDGHASRQLRLKYIALPIAMVFLAMTWVGAIIDFVLILAIVPNKIKRYLDIRKGVSQVKSGDLTYQIPVEKNPRNGGPASDFDKLAGDINQIAVATNTAVQNELKNQRMKTDLISNVSHDLKTPLTSMISYLDILKREGLDSPHAAEYLDIVSEKTEKLRTLTDDLFEAAKASSGSIPCNIESIDLAQMLDQELAEMGDMLEEKGLEIIRKTEADNTVVQADGKLLSRVIENLLGNVSKYALENSRVYIDLTEAGAAKVRLDIKNISRDQLNISPEELMERFTRGDASRNTEGSGLGLAIAKDLTRLMGGSFDITIDGDMFKASVTL